MNKKVIKEEKKIVKKKNKKKKEKKILGNQLMKNLEKLDKEVNGENFLIGHNFENENLMFEEDFFGENLKMNLKGFSKEKIGEDFKIMENHQDVFIYRLKEIDLNHNFDKKKIKEFKDFYSRKNCDSVVTNKKELDYIKVDKKNIEKEKEFLDLNKKILKENHFLKKYKEKNLTDLNEDFFQLWKNILKKDEKSFLKSEFFNK